MSTPSPVQVFLENNLLERARKREHNFLRLVQDVIESAGLRVVFLHEDDRPNRYDGLSLVHMKPPLGRRGLTFRRVYHYPFWQIEQTDKRWAWEVARDAFDPDEVPEDAARTFQRFWRNRLFDATKTTATPDGPVYVPLQGRLRAHRSFQSMSPLEMIETTLRYDKQRSILATLHPKESYTTAELTALDTLERKYARLTLSAGPPRDFLQNCAYVVTQNSAAAFGGYFFDTPAILFARIDFHHIAQNITEVGAEEAFAQVLEDPPDYAKYLFWFWQQKSINAGREDAPQKIRARLARFGWPV